MDKLNVIKLFFYENKKKIIVVLILLLLLISGLSISLNSKSFNNHKEKVVFENVVEEKQKTKSDETEYYYIDIKGYVNNPGVYSIAKGKRVVDALNIAGGLREEADTSLLNLSMVLKDEMVIIVYSKSELVELETIISKKNSENLICNQKVVNDACIVNNKSIEIIPNNNAFNKSDDSIASEKININTANIDLLMTLSGIGESKASAIIEYRKQNGDFNSIFDIKKVTGIGESIFESIKDYITV